MHRTELSFGGPNCAIAAQGFSPSRDSEIAENADPRSLMGLHRPVEID